MGEPWDGSACRRVLRWIMKNTIATLGNTVAWYTAWPAVPASCPTYTHNCTTTAQPLRTALHTLPSSAWNPTDPSPHPGMSRSEVPRGDTPTPTMVHNPGSSISTSKNARPGLSGATYRGPHIHTSTRNTATHKHVHTPHKNVPVNRKWHRAAQRSAAHHTHACRHCSTVWNALTYVMATADMTPPMGEVGVVPTEVTTATPSSSALTTASATRPSMQVVVSVSSGGRPAWESTNV